MFDVITVGSSTVDIFAHTENARMIRLRSSKSRREFISYPVGSKILVTKLLQNFGGNGANAAVSFSRLGFRTGYVGKIGKDLTGAQILDCLKKNRVTFLGARGEQSGTSIILDAMGEDRTILGFKGCNNELLPSELTLQKIDARCFYFSSMIGKSLRSMEAIAARARRKKRMIAFNPSQTILERDLTAARRIARLSDLIVLNKEEAELLVGNERAEKSLARIAALGPRTAVITDGRNGALALQDGTYYRVMPRKGIKIVETTGAGDAFASTLAAMLILKKPMAQALKLAIIQAESVIAHHGAQNNLLRKAELLALAARDKRKVAEKKA